MQFFFKFNEQANAFQSKQQSGIFIEYSGTKKSISCCHPPFHPPNFCRHSLKLLSPTLPKLVNWMLLLPPPLSSDPDNPPKFGTCTWLLLKKHEFCKSSLTSELRCLSHTINFCTYVTNFRAVAYHHKTTIVKEFVLL